MTNWFDVYAKAAIKEVEECGSDIAEGVRTLRVAYRRISSEVGPQLEVDYDQPNMRAAYLYLYGPLHSDMVREEVEDLLRDTRLDHLATARDVRICSLGGGPGCDVVGTRAALLRTTSASNVSASVFDLHDGWSTTYYRVTWAAGQDPIRDNYYGEVDLVEANNRLYPVQRDYVSEISRADIVTVVKFFSVVAHNKGKARNFLQHLTSKLKPGTLVLYIDNAAGGFTEQFTLEMVRNSMIVLKNYRRRFKMSSVFFWLSTQSLSYLRSTVSTEPLYECSVSVTAWLKPLTTLHHSNIMSSAQDSLNRRARSYGVVRFENDDDNNGARRRTRSNDLPNDQHDFDYYLQGIRSTTANRPTVQRSQSDSPADNFEYYLDCIRSADSNRRHSNSNEQRASRHDHPRLDLMPGFPSHTHPDILSNREIITLGSSVANQRVDQNTIVPRHTTDGTSTRAAGRPLRQNDLPSTEYDQAVRHLLDLTESLVQSANRSQQNCGIS